MLASPAAGSSSASRLRMVTFGQTTSTTSENAASLRSLTLFRMLQAASMPMTVVLPVPGGHLAGVAKKGGEALRLACPSPGSSQRHVEPLAEIGPRFDQKDDRFGRFELGEEQRCVSRPSRRHHCSRSSVVRDTPG